MKVLFVTRLQRGLNEWDYFYMQLGISYISSFLKQHNHDTDLLVLPQKVKKESINSAVHRFKPGLICFTAVATDYNHISRVARYIKKTYPSIYLLAGGPHVSLNPVDVIEDALDALCIGEGEHACLELVEQLEKGMKPANIRNLWIKNHIEDNKEIEKNPTREFIQDLDSLPFPDREMWRKWLVEESPEPLQTVLIGRGCPYNCTYCCNHGLKKLAPGKYVRLRSPGNIIKEIEEITAAFPNTKRIYFEIETIGVNMEFAVDLCSRLELFHKARNHYLTYGINLRVAPKIDYDNLFMAFKQANFKYVNIGLESGSKRVREEVLNRHYSNQDVMDVVNLAKKYGLSVILYVLMGLPGETLADFEETIACTKKLNPDRVSLSIFYPYPGTDLHKLCLEKNLIDEKIPNVIERFVPALDLPGFSKQQIRQQFYHFFDNIKN